MTISVHNISTTSARVSWPAAPGCLDTFYSVMYHPNWNSLLMGYTRKSFLREERVPVTQTSASLLHLAPQTTYILCVTCQAANPLRDQCQVFSTPREGGGQRQDGSGWEMAMGVWMASSLLLLVIAGVLLWGCLHSICPFPSQASGEGYPCSSSALPQGAQGSPGCLYTPSSSEEDDSKQVTVLGNPLHSVPTPGHGHARGHELRTLSPQTEGQPV
ncbi:fibronectin type III domain-containing protein 9 [Hypomesus transpacificus]|uniref:fibronectin type III domain-containing protein 9 n=1 Tax=Hypomesus transpacificus TaxID=137520 RepID=UPI001F07C7DE|nr:fibronectin type III domain-containing protein 9 [Hypomesus transpacificus]